MKKQVFIIFLLIIFCCPAKAASFSKKVGSETLKITAPKTFQWKGQTVFADKSKQLKVIVDYGDLKVRTNRVTYDPGKGMIELSEGFRGKMDQYQLEGDYFRVNTRTGNYSGYDLKFGYLGAYFYGKEFTFHGDRISVDQIAVSPTEYPIIRLNANLLEFYPGYMLVSRSTLKLLELPIYFIPLYVDDSRRTYFDLPFPAPEFKSDVFHGLQSAVHTHYFLNPSLYGDISLRHSEISGFGAGLMQFVRLSDYHQLQLGVLNWAKSDMQANAAYELQFFGNPRKPDQQLPFQKQQLLEEEVAAIEPWAVLHSDYAVNEEIKRSIVDLYPDSSLTIYLKGLLFKHTYTLTPALHYGRIKEKRIYPEGAPMQDVNRDYTRIMTDLNFTYYYPTPRLDPFINKVLLGLGYEHSVYDPGNTSRSRVAAILTVRRPILKNLGLYYEGILTKTLVDSGTSPFYFENYGRLMDSGTLDIYLQLAFLIAGNQLVYDFTNMQGYNEIYYLGVKAGTNYATLQYDRRMDSWQLAIISKETPF